MAAKFNDDVRKGDDYGPKVSQYRQKATKAPVNLTGATVTGRVFNASGTVATFTCSIVDASQGKFSFWLPSAVTNGLAIGKYDWELKITLPNPLGSGAPITKTFFTGQFVVTA